jgi:hypothetical protein
LVVSLDMGHGQLSSLGCLNKLSRSIPVVRSPSKTFPSRGFWDRRSRRECFFATAGAGCHVRFAFSPFGFWSAKSFKRKAPPGRLIIPTKIHSAFPSPLRQGPVRARCVMTTMRRICQPIRGEVLSDVVRLPKDGQGTPVHCRYVCLPLPQLDSLPAKNGTLPRGCRAYSIKPTMGSV